MKVWEDIENIKNCPIEVSLKYLGKKWTLQIIRDLFKGKKRFSEFLKANPLISTKMLSVRLTELTDLGIIRKEVISTLPVKVNYFLTKKGKALNKVLFELAEFSLQNYPNEIYHNKPNSIKSDIMNLKDFFNANKH
ncbi:MAG: helix-turn-helix transcriptional regulator [Candidatus Lokiarchaeota archaeon]|nr:helix-turn-helix transcriptional regulator [Candidatus Lokiarchaeota archaeon]